MASAVLDPQSLQLPPETPATGAPPEPEQESDPWNENIAENLKTQILWLARKFTDEDKFSRRIEIQESRRAHFFWRGMQHLYWDYRMEGWAVFGPQGASLPSGGARQGYNEDSSVLFVTNIYQAFGLSIMAVLSQSLPGVRFEPQDPNDAADIATAKAGERFKKIIEHENDGVALFTRAAFFAWTDGRIGAWTRWEEDSRTGQGREKISVHGVLSTKVPVTADCEEEFVYVQFSDEYHVALMKEEYPKIADKIKGGAQGNGQDVYERTARISVKQGTAVLSQSGDTLTNLATRQRTWMRPAAFELLDKDAPEKEQLKSLFPNGVHVVCIGPEYAGARAESMDDAWAFTHPLPGDGQYRNAMGTVMISVQERFNDIINIAQDIYEKCIPAGWVASDAVDIDGVFRQRSMPAARYSIVKKPGEAIADNFFFEPAATVSADMLQYATDLMGDVSQFLTGAYPALFGGTQPDQKTASGYAMARDQAMGRIGLVYRMLKRWWSKINEQAVRCAAANRTQDMSIAEPDENGEIQTTSVRLEELKGEIYAFPDTDEGFPESWTQKSAKLMQLIQLGGNNPVLEKILADPSNMEQEQKMLGLEDFNIPGSNAVAKCKMTIARLLKGTPVPNPQFEQAKQNLAQMQMDSANGVIHPDENVAQIAMTLKNTPPMSPSEQVNPDFDDPAIIFSTVKEWYQTMEAQKAVADPKTKAGFSNVLLYGQQAKQMMIAQMSAMQPPPPPKPAHAPPVHVHVGGAGAPPQAQAA